MNHYRTGCAIILTSFLASCGKPRVEYVNVIPEVPAELRTPVAVPARRANTLGDVAVILTDHVAALDAANGKISATDCILTAAEAGRDPDCF